MSRYTTLFSQLSEKQQGAFIPFVTLGDPNIEISYQIIECLLESGADALELAIPFSDPLADGPVIQRANLRAFEAEVKPDQCFELLHKIRAHYPEVPIGLLMYANLVYNNGIENFYAKCQQSGVDSVLIADVPLEESAPYIAAAIKYSIDPVFICPPDADEAFIEHMATLSQGYTYLLSRGGVTGFEEAESIQKHDQLLTLLKKHHAVPAIQGFGISTPAHVKSVMASGAAGAISGSAIVNIIEKNLDNIDAMLRELSQFTKEMKQATR